MYDVSRLQEPRPSLPEQKIRKAKKSALAAAGAVFWLLEVLETNRNEIV